MDDPERRFWIELSYRYATPVHILQHQISSEHFVELMAEEAIEPRGEIRADLRAGIVASVIRNCNRSKKTDPVAEPIDYMPKFGSRREKGRTFDPQALARQLAAVANRAKATTTKDEK
jgi:hypothetical protein